MRTIDYIQDVVLPGAYALLPPRMCSPEADAMLLAVGLQESRFIHRVQLIGKNRHWWESLKGSARGWWQFERAGGVRGVLRHPASRPHALRVLDLLSYPERPWMIHRAVAHNDVLAACFARLLLYTDPNALPALTSDPEVSWRYYLRPWRPGKPHRGTWDDFWEQATAAVMGSNRRLSDERSWRTYP